MFETTLQLRWVGGRCYLIGLMGADVCEERLDMFSVTLPEC